MATKTKTKNMDRWIEGVIMTIFETNDPGTNFTRNHLVTEIDNKYADKDWAKLAYFDKADAVTRVIKKMARKKFVIGTPTYNYGRLYSVKRGTL